MHSMYSQSGYMGNKMRPGSAIWLNRTTGHFRYWMDEHREMNCNMDFERYPMDEQICYFKIVSGSYGLPNLVRADLRGLLLYSLMARLI